MTAGKASCITSLIASTLLVSALWSQADVPVPAPDPVAPVAPAVQQVSPQETDPAPQPAPQTQTPLDAPAVEAPPANTAVPSAPANVGPSPSAAPLVEPPASIPATAQETPKGKRDKKNRGGKTAAKRVGPSQSETEPEFKITSDVELVLLDVSVKDSQGGFVSGLQKDHFKVFENRLPQDVKTFTAQDAPVTVGLVVDNSGSVRPKKAEIVTAALTFVTQSNPADETFIVNFNDKVSMGLPDGMDFSSDRILLREALMTNPAQGRTSLYDAMKSALEHLEKGRLDKKTLVVIADGGDNMSETAEHEIHQLIESSLATVYTIGIYNPEDKDKNPGFLKSVARISGGEYFEPGDLSKLVGVCEKIAKDIRNRYTIGYTPTQLAANQGGKTRKIRVLASHPSDGRLLKVRTRTEYSLERPELRSRAEGHAQ